MGAVQWWCSAVDLPWTWEWRAYPGVWLFIGLLAVAYFRLTRIAPNPPAEEASRRRAAGIGGILALWVAFDWPVGTLGGAYLASMHMLQYLLIAFVAPVLLIVGLPRGTSEALYRTAAGPVLKALTHPIVAAGLFNAALITTHTPTVTDGFMASQAGSFAIDMLWLFPALLFWWNVVGVPPGRKPLAPPLKIGTIILGTLTHTPLGMWMMLSEYPVYSTYELAPPIPGFTPIVDQQLASGLMLMLGWLWILGAISLTFFRWQGLGEERA